MLGNVRFSDRSQCGGELSFQEITVVSNDLTSRVATGEDSRDTEGRCTLWSWVLPQIQSQRGAQGSQPVLLSVSFLFQGEKESKEHHLNQFAEEGKFARVSGEEIQDINLSIPGLMKEKFLNIFWSILLMRVLSANDSRGFSFKNSLSKLLQSYGDFLIRV